MKVKALLNMLKPHIEHSIVRGDFLLPSNRLSHSWVHWQLVNTQTVRILVRDILAAFWTNYLKAHDGSYVLVTLEYFGETSENTLFTETLIREVIVMVNNPRLSCDKILVDPDSFELSLEHHYSGIQVVIFVVLLEPIDMLSAVVKNLRLLGCLTTTMMALMERRSDEGVSLADTLQLDVIPLTSYAEQTHKLFSVLELPHEPYRNYHPYFL